MSHKEDIPCMKIQVQKVKARKAAKFILAKLGYNKKFLAESTCSSQTGLPRFSKWKYCMGHTYTKKLFVVYLKLKFNWVSCILSGNPRSHGGSSICMWVSALERLKMGKDLQATLGLCLFCTFFWFPGCLRWWLGDRSRCRVGYLPAPCALWRTLLVPCGDHSLLRWNCNRQYPMFFSIGFPKKKTEQYKYES